MKPFIRPPIIVVGTMAVALFAWSTVATAAGANKSHLAVQSTESMHVEHSPEAQVELEPALAPKPERQNEAPQAPQERNELPEVAEQHENEHPIANQIPPPPAPTVSTRTFALVGGTVTFRCTGNVISLVSAAPNSGFSTETETEDGGQQIKVKFESGMHKSEIRAACVGGQVQANELREESH